MKKTIWVSTPSKRYPIYFRKGSSWEYLHSLTKKYSDRQLFLITDSHLKRIYQTQLSALQVAGVTILHFPAGETAKTHITKLRLEEKLFKAHCSRKDMILALGGGVVGDLAGFVAATFMRGINYINIPTTLIAAADSAIGGKTAIDTPFGKNLIGAFHHPEAVFIDLDFFKTLPHAEYHSGLAEVAKYALIKNLTLYKLLLKKSESYKTCHIDHLPRILTESVLTKTQVVTHDENELGYRRILNFGHTLGHAIEQLSNYTIKHGIAVSMGMALEAWLSYRLGFLTQQNFNKVIELLYLLDLPVNIPNLSTSPKRFTAKTLYQTSMSDKKNSGQVVQFTALRRLRDVVPSKGAFVVPLEYPFFAKAFKEFQKLKF